MQFDDSTSDNKKTKSGIKSFLYTATGKNGESHRKNKAKKALHAVANRAARAALYQERVRMGAVQWHATLESISKGLV